MAIAKILATYIFDGHQLYPPLSQVLVYDSTSGAILDLVPATQVSEPLPLISGLVAPGLVNAHCHLELSHLYGRIARHCGLPEFLLAVIRQRQLHSEEESAQAREQIQASLEFAYTQGTRVIGDIVSTELSLAVKQGYSGAVRLHNFIELVGFDALWPAWKRKQFQQLYADFLSSGLASSMALHAPYSVGQDLLEYWLATQTHVSTIHNQECAAENQLYLHGNGEFIEFYQQLGIDYQHFSPPACSSFQYFLPYMTSNSGQCIFVHNTFMHPEDIDFFLQQAPEIRERSFFAICARANDYIEGRLPAKALFLKLQEHLVIGTDSLAANSDLSLLNELIFLKQHYGLKTADLLRWASSNGAKALGLKGEYGQFTRGAKPGIIRIYPVDSAGELVPESQVQNLA